MNGKNSMYAVTRGLNRSISDPAVNGLLARVANS